MAAVLIECNIVVLGSTAVGKSCIALRFANDAFLEDHDPTIEDTYRKNLTINDESYSLHIKDTAGDEEYHGRRDGYISEGDGFLLVYSILDYNSFEAVMDIYKTIQIIRNSTPGGVPACVFAGNKCDLEDKRVVQKTDAIGRTQNIGKLFETSAVSNIHIEDAFRHLAEEIKKFKDRANQKPPKKFCLLL